MITEEKKTEIKNLLWLQYLVSENIFSDFEDEITESIEAISFSTDIKTLLYINIADQLCFKTREDFFFLFVKKLSPETQKTVIMHSQNKDVIEDFLKEWDHWDTITYDEVLNPPFYDNKTSIPKVLLKQLVEDGTLLKNQNLIGSKWVEILREFLSKAKPEEISSLNFHPGILGVIEELIIKVRELPIEVYSRIADTIEIGINESAYVFLLWYLSCNNGITSELFSKLQRTKDPEIKRILERSQEK